MKHLAVLVIGLGWWANPDYGGGTAGAATTGGSVADVAQLYSTDQSQRLEVELVSWQSEGFRAIVVTGDDAGLFPVDGELLVFFEDDTEIFLADGTTFPYTADDSRAEEIGWEEGTSVSVTFSTYEEYQPGNHLMVISKYFGITIDISTFKAYNSHIK
ncbi:MAG: hypothetical protein R3Y62_02100 [Eubacteriales bacterium]